MGKHPIRVLIAKLGLDGHDRGAKIIARSLRDAGMEVVYTGLRQTPAMIAEAALHEDVNVVGISILSGAHNTLLPTLMDKLREQNLAHIPVIVGGIVPDCDVNTLMDAGVSAVFGPGTLTSDIVTSISNVIESDLQD